ncbi:MAG: ATP-binding protein [Nocardioidaceae bacterium]|nr:ATP-binding protein [Nocardioidaceae bacterium]
MPDDASVTRVSLEAAAREDSVDLLHTLVASLWEGSPDVAMIDRIRFETAVIEVMANIVEHAYAIDGEGVTGRRFDVSLLADPTSLVATFADDGRPCEIDLSTVSMPGYDAESGRGLALASAAVDDLAYHRDGVINHWSITCRRQP